MENFTTITNAEISEGFVNKETVDFENALSADLINGVNSKAVIDAYSDLFDSLVD